MLTVQLREKPVRLWRLSAVALLASSAGCALLAPEPSPEEAPADCRFPADTELAFAGESTLAELGLDGDHVDRRARFYVTANRIDHEWIADVPFPPGRRFCAFAAASGAGFTGPVPDDWQPPQ